MSAKQGETYRITAPADKPGRRLIGQGNGLGHYHCDVDGVVVSDWFGDVVHASEHVAYPRGANESYRHVRWIDEHPERFQKIQKD